jgi:hypothetical protein
MSSKIFDLKTSTGELMTNEGVTEVFYDRLNPQRSVSDTASFTQGQLNWTWEGSSGQWWVPNQCYFEMTIEYRNNANNPPVIADGVAPALNAMSNLFQSLEFQINDKQVSLVSDYVAQCDTLLKRIYSSESFINNGYNNQFWDSYGLRVNKVATLGKMVSDDDGLNAVGPMTIRKNKVVIQWKPMCLGIFRLPHGIPSVARFRLIAQPYSTNIAGNAYETKNNTAPAQPNISNLVFFVAQCQGPRYDKGSFLLDLENITCQARPVTGGRDLSSNQFDVSPTTYAISVAYQASQVADATVASGIAAKSTLRGAYDKANPYTIGAGTCSELGISRIYVNYGANKVYPTSDLALSYNGNTNSITPLYALTQSQIDVADDPAGGEPLEVFFQRGWFLHLKTPRDATDKSTRVQLNQAFASATDDPSVRAMNALVFSHYRSVVEVTVDNGRVSDVAISYD